MINNKLPQLTTMSEKEINEKFDGIPNPNILVNSDFRNPINLSGKTEWEADTAPKTYEPFLIQEWYRRDSMTGVYLKDGYIRVVVGEQAQNSNDTGRGFSQELSRESIVGKTVTLTVSIKNIKGKWMIRPNANTANKYLFSNQIDKNKSPLFVEKAGIYVHKFDILDDLSLFNWITFGFYTDNVSYNAQVGDFIDIEWVKLELGDKATPLPYEDSKVKQLKTDGVPLLYGGERIRENEDLNNYAIVGNYYCLYGSETVSLKNIPKGLQNGFTMVVKAGNGKIFDDDIEDSYFLQKIESYHGETYKRLITKSGKNKEYYYGNWTKVAIDNSSQLNTIENLVRESKSDIIDEYTLELIEQGVIK